VSQTACLERIRRIQYRALTYANLVFSGPTQSTYATAATAQLAPTEAAPLLYRNPPDDWATSEGALP